MLLGIRVRADIHLPSPFRPLGTGLKGLDSISIRAGQLFGEGSVAEIRRSGRATRPR